jgi:hypothetical protein
MVPTVKEEGKSCDRRSLFPSSRENRFALPKFEPQEAVLACSSNTLPRSMLQPRFAMLRFRETGFNRQSSHFGPAKFSPAIIIFPSERQAVAC